MRCWCTIGWLACVLAGLTGCRSAMLETGFETDPVRDGWRTGVFGGPLFAGDWVETNAWRGRHCLAVRAGLWESPALPVEPFAYYRVSFAYKAVKPGFRLVRYSDAAGNQLVADDHDILDPSPDWTVGEFWTQAREGSASMRAAFGASGAEVFVDGVRIERATSRQVLSAADRLYGTLPPLRCVPEPDRWKRLPRTRQLLDEGKPLRVLLLGDSIANDIGNSLFDALIESMYPGAQITLLRSIRPGTGCVYYREHVKEYVIDKEPDLVVIAGISHDCDPAAMRSVAEQTRQAAKKPVDFLVMTGAVIEPGMSSQWKSKGLDCPPVAVRQQAVVAEARFYAELVSIRDEVPWATLDMRTIWEDYLAHSPWPRQWYQRDFVHANARGKQILGRILQEFFRPGIEGQPGSGPREAR